jgi:hypothetical protein
MLNENKMMSRVVRPHGSRAARVQQTKQNKTKQNKV